MQDPDNKGPQWLRDYFTDVDAMDLEAYIAHHTDDVVVTFGNNPSAEGKEQVRGAIGNFWETIQGLDHRFVDVFEDGDSTVLEEVVTYTRNDGAVVDVPGASLFHRTGGKVDRLSIYIDLAPVYAGAIATEETAAS